MFASAAGLPRLQKVAPAGVDAGRADPIYITACSGILFARAFSEASDAKSVSVDRVLCANDRMHF